MSYRILVLFFAVVVFQSSAQVKIRGLSFWNSPSLNIYQTTNFLSNERSLLATVTPDSIGIFNVQLPIKQICQLQICSDDKCGWLYVQPKSRYIIELPSDEGVQSLADQKEIELLFYQLDSTDINYQILGFEAWMDNYLADIYQLKDLRSNEFISKIRTFKKETAANYNNDSLPYLKSYVKYSVGLTVDNFSVLGGPTKEDKYAFYLSTDSIDYQQPKLIEFAKAFYQNYFDQLEAASRSKAQAALADNQYENYIAIIQADPYIFNRNWAEFVALQSLLDMLYAQRINPDLALNAIKYLKLNASQKDLRQAAAYFWQANNQLKIGKKIPEQLLSELLRMELPNGNICLHFYQPGNQKCIAELSALKKVAQRHQENIHIITIYPSRTLMSKADLKALEPLNWPKIALEPESEIWQLLNWSSAPAYILIDAQQIVRYMPALSPVPDGRGQTIDTQILQLH